MAEATIKPAAEMKNFETGSRRGSSKGKGRYDLLAFATLRRQAKHLEQGAVHYGDRNWQKGQPLGRYIDSALRHLFQWIEGERDEPHLAAFVWNAIALDWTANAILEGKLPRSLDDAGYLTPDLAEGMGEEPSEDEEEPSKADEAVRAFFAGAKAKSILENYGPMNLKAFYAKMETYGFGPVEAFKARKYLNTWTWLMQDSPTPRDENYLVGLPTQPRPEGGPTHAA